MTVGQFVQRIASAVFPQRCIFCGGLTAAGEEACADCLARLSRVPAGESVFQGSPFAFRGCAAPFYYEGPAKQGVLRLKFRGKPQLAAAFARYVAPRAAEDLRGVSFDVVTCVPLSRNEMKKRGYNQSGELAKALSRIMNIPYEELLRKPHDIRPQRSLSKKERAGNVFGAFEAEERATGKNILLIDDIATTGATLNECSKVLKLSGAAEVCCAVIACVRSRSDAK